MREIKFRSFDDLTREMTPSFSFKEFCYKGIFNLFPKMEHFSTKFIMQFTGLTDKNGKEIYEGDIITVLVFDSNQECTVSEVKFVKYNTCSFDVYNPDGTWEIFLEDVQEDCEVIGNIHETPELLNVAHSRAL